MYDCRDFHCCPLPNKINLHELTLITSCHDLRTFCTKLLWTTMAATRAYTKYDNLLISQIIWKHMWLYKANNYNDISQSLLNSTKQIQNDWYMY